MLYGRPGRPRRERRPGAGALGDRRVRTRHGQGGSWLGPGRWRSLRTPALCRARLGMMTRLHASDTPPTEPGCPVLAVAAHAYAMLHAQCSPCALRFARHAVVQGAHLRPVCFQVALHASAFNNTQSRTRARIGAGQRSWARAQQCGARRVRQRSSRRPPRGVLLLAPLMRLRWGGPRVWTSGSEHV